jgi:hypothetical protein
VDYDVGEYKSLFFDVYLSSFHKLTCNETDAKYYQQNFTIAIK